MDFNVNGHEVVNLYDVKGNLVQEIRNLRNNFFILNSGLIKGVYFLKIQRDVDITYGKLIVQ